MTQEIGGCEIWEEIARGGMGIVYRGLQRALNRVVAVKMLDPSLATSPEFRERFRNEAATIARLSHPNVVRVHDIEEADGTWYIVMEFVGGPSLWHVSQGAGALHPGRAADIALQTAQALAAAHAEGVVHRDIKPPNLLFTPAGVVKVTDFGIAKLSGGSLRTVPGVRLGTPAYMSPEQAQAGEIDARSDLYSLATVLFELVTGRLPFDGADPFAVALAHIMQPAPDPRSFRAGVPNDIANVILRGMAKSPSARFQSAEEMIAALAPIAERERRRIVREEPRTGAPQCPGCGAGLRHEFEACPTCGTRLSRPCAVCRQSYRTTFPHCPYCWGLAAPAARAVPVPPPLPLPAAPAGDRAARVREAGERVLTALRGIWGSARPAPRLSCAGCGTELRPEFRRCPVCGKEVS